MKYIAVIIISVMVGFGIGILCLYHRFGPLLKRVDAFESVRDKLESYSDRDIAYVIRIYRKSNKAGYSPQSDPVVISYLAGYYQSRSKFSSQEKEAAMVVKSLLRDIEQMSFQDKALEEAIIKARNSTNAGPLLKPDQ